MPYKYDRKYETVEDIAKEYNRPYAPKVFPGTHLYDRVYREEAARRREQYLKELEFQDQMAARPFTLNIDMRNKYEIRNAIHVLQAALEELEKEEFVIPYDPNEFDI